MLIKLFVSRKTDFLEKEIELENFQSIIMKKGVPFICTIVFNADEFGKFMFFAVPNLSLIQLNYK